MTEWTNDELNKIGSAEELRIAADLIGWRKHWHPHGKGKKQGDADTLEIEYRFEALKPHQKPGAPTLR